MLSSTMSKIEPVSLLSVGELKSSNEIVVVRKVRHVGYVVPVIYVRAHLASPLVQSSEECFRFPVSDILIRNKDFDHFESASSASRRCAEMKMHPSAPHPHTTWCNRSIRSAFTTSPRLSIELNTSISWRAADMSLRDKRLPDIVLYSVNPVVKLGNCCGWLLVHVCRRIC